MPKGKYKIKVLSYREHEQCQPDHKLILITQPDGIRYPIESCGKINFYLHIMKVKYGWKLETIGMYTKENIEKLEEDLARRDLEEHHARDTDEAVTAVKAEVREVRSDSPTGNNPTDR